MSQRSAKEIQEEMARIDRTRGLLIGCTNSLEQLEEIDGSYWPYRKKLETELAEAERREADRGTT